MGLSVRASARVCPSYSSSLFRPARLSGEGRGDHGATRKSRVRPPLPTSPECCLCRREEEGGGRGGAALEVQRVTFSHVARCPTVFSCCLVFALTLNERALLQVAAQQPKADLSHSNAHARHVLKLARALNRTPPGWRREEGGGERAGREEGSHPLFGRRHAIVLR